MANYQDPSIGYGPLMRVITTDTPDGDFYMLVDADDIVRASGYGTLEALVLRLPVNLQGELLKSIGVHPYQKLVQAYYAGDKTALDKIPRMQQGSDFQSKVWRAISSIGYGETVSYKQLADKSGNAGAIRAAGTICGLNRLILLVPCHRVLKSDGSTGSYLYGPQIKESLLRHEGAHVKTRLVGTLA